MKNPHPKARLFWRSAIFSVALGSLAVGLTSCNDPKPCSQGSDGAYTVGRLTQSSVQKLDLLLAIDNSRSMADKQAILAQTVPYLVRTFASPPCVSEVTGQIEQWVGPHDLCPAGTARPREPLTDIHIGVISTSLGGHGSDACSTAGAGKASNNDRAHLLARLDPTQPAAVETYQNLGFLAWDPDQALTPPGEADIESDSASDVNMTALSDSLSKMTLGVGEIGCGYEAQLESWYRFLIEPMPPENVTLDADNRVLLEGIDKVLLDQRKAFLRPDSLLAIVLLSDENDCSIREQGQFYYAAQQKAANGSAFRLPRARAMCDTSPNDQCCFSCGQAGPKDDNGNPVCPDDPTCKEASGNTAYYDELEDNINLRCFNQKRRFGIDFLYGIDRYKDALVSQTVTDRNGQVMPNPIFSDLDPSDAVSNVRTSQLVVFAGIVGVPWQDIARTNQNGDPDLEVGLNADGKAVGGFKSADELLMPLPGKDYPTWDLILGDPSAYPAASALPKDPLMIESIEPRTGTHPITGDTLVTSAQPLGNLINGHEYSIPQRDDLQYTCIFPIEPRDCAAGATAGCDCTDPQNDSPLCEVDPLTGDPTKQVYAKAYPGLRELMLIKALGGQGVLGSICPRQTNQPDQRDFAYSMVADGIAERLDFSEKTDCAGTQLKADEAGRVECAIFEAQQVNDDTLAECQQCNRWGRATVAAESQGAFDAVQADPSAANFNCFCEIPQLTGSAEGEPLQACQNDLSGAPTTADGDRVDGFCYIDEEANLGNPAIVQNCPENGHRMIRFVGDGKPVSGSTVFIACGAPPIDCETP